MREGRAGSRGIGPEDQGAAVQGRGYRTKYDYDLGGRLTTLTYPPAGLTPGPADQIAYNYFHGTSLLQFVSVGTGAHVADFADYDALGQAATITYGNGTRTKKTLDPWSGALTALVASPPNQTAGGSPAIDLINVSFERTGGGDISKLLDYRLGSNLGQSPNHVDFTYAYDMQGRLASETLSALAGTLAARPSSVLFDPHSTRVDPYGLDPAWWTV